VVEPALRSLAGVSRLRELMRRWMGWSTRSGLPGGCPLYGAAFELDDAAPGPVRDFLLERHREWTGLLSRLVREAVDRGELARDLNIEQFVWQLIGVYLAHHLAQRLCADPNADARGMAAFEDIVACAALARGGASTPSGAEDEMLR
jgi:hypothetical protein